MLYSYAESESSSQRCELRLDRPDLEPPGPGINTVLILYQGSEFGSDSDCRSVALRLRPARSLVSCFLRDRASIAHSLVA
jgi:hypothetical protein